MKADTQTGVEGVNRSQMPKSASYSAALRAAELGFWEYTVPGSWRWSPELCSLIGRSSDPRCTTAPLSTLIHPADEFRVRSRLAESLSDPQQSLYKDEFRLICPDGEACWFLARGQIERDLSGTAQSVSGVLLNITDRKRMEDEIRRSNAELEHRTKNILSIVQSIAVHSFGEDMSSDDVRDVFLDRLHAMARVYAAIANGDRRGASLHEIVNGEIEQFGARAEVEGPAVILNPVAARSVALMIHELVAESARSGALSIRTGRISVQWKIERGAAPEFSLRWSERSEARRTPQSGPNSPLLAKVSAAMGITGHLEHTPWGIKYKVEMPLSVIADTAPERA